MHSSSRIDNSEKAIPDGGWSLRPEQLAELVSNMRRIVEVVDRAI